MCGIRFRTEPVIGHRLAALAFLSLVGAAQPASAQEAPTELPLIDHVVVQKAARTITLYSQGQAVHVIGSIQLGGQPLGDKQFEGDKRTPEGRYWIDYGNPESSYYLSIHISYPDAEDIAHAERHGRSPGGQIFIHGQPNWLNTGRMSGDWTDGCIAVSNAEMDLLWEFVPDGTAIDILP